MFQSINSKIKKIVEELQKGAGTKSKIAEETQLSVDRKNFLNRGIYYDSKWPMRYGATISAPHIHALALEKLFEPLKTVKYIRDIISGIRILT